MIEYTVQVYPNGTKRWYLNGKNHREDGPAIEYPSGAKFWYLNGKKHREDGPAIEYDNGDKYWYFNGERHREDGPAVEYPSGAKFWYLNGVFMNEAKHKAKMNPVKEMTMAELEAALGYSVKVVK